MRIKRLVVELAAVPRPESIITWMRQPATALLLTKIGTRELHLSHEAFNAEPPSRSLEHLREMLVSHRMMPDRGDRHLARFQRWLDQRLLTLHDTPAIATPIEQFARWHHLRRLLENTNTGSDMDNATRSAKQEITEAGKFLTWLLTEHRTAIDNLTQAQLDIYLSEGTTTRTLVRNFIQWRARTGIAPPLETRYRIARATPLASTRQRLDLIKHAVEADDVILSTRIAALLLLLFGTPVTRICELRIDDIDVTPTRTTIKLGDTPAPIPEPLLPLFHQHLAQRANRRTMNHRSTWLFPGTNAGLRAGGANSAVALTGCKNRPMVGMSSASPTWYPSSDPMGPASRRRSAPLLAAAIASPTPIRSERIWASTCRDGRIRAPSTVACPYDERRVSASTSPGRGR